MEAPFELPAISEIRYEMRYAETLRTLWSFGRGEPVKLVTIASGINLDEAKTLDWLRNNGKASWKTDDDGQTWKPLIGRSWR